MNMGALIRKTGKGRARARSHFRGVSIYLSTFELSQNVFQCAHHRCRTVFFLEKTRQSVGFFFLKAKNNRIALGKAIIAMTANVRINGSDTTLMMGGLFVFQEWGGGCGGGGVGGGHSTPTGAQKETEKKKKTAVQVKNTA
jgi:hypothetical protein